MPDNEKPAMPETHSEPEHQTDAKPAAPDGEASPVEENLAAWQSRLLPFMIIMIAGLTIFFFVASFAQLAYLHWNILQGTRVDVRQSLDVMSNETLTTPEEVLAAAQLQSFTTLELYTLERRYHQANVLLMSRVWINYLGFVTGMILALVGATFIIGKLREPASKAGGEVGPAKFSFEGASPGMFLAALGVALMLTTLITHHDITVVDKSVYAQLATNGSLGGGSSSVMESPAEAPPLTLPDESAGGDVVSPAD